MKKRFIKILTVSSIMAIFAVGFLSATFANAQPAVPVAPACPFTSNDGTVINFPSARLVGGDPVNWGGAGNGIYNFVDSNASLPVGIYTVKTFSWDGYMGRVEATNTWGPQLNEQWNVEAYNGTTLLGIVGPTSDLNDYVEEDSVTNTFTEGLTTTQNSTKVRAVHAHLTNDNTANSVVPICAAFKKKSGGGDLVVEFEKTPLFNEGDSKPGDNTTRWIKVTNNTDETHRIAIEAINKTDPDNFSEKFNLIIKEGATEIFNGTLKKFFGQGETYLSSLLSGATTQYDLTAYFDINAGNEYQEKTLGFDLVVGFEGEEGGLPLPDPGEGTNNGGVGGGGGGGGNGPPRGLSITDETVVDAYDTSATITWNTSYNSTSQVIYGLETENHTLDLTDISGNPPKYGYERTTPEYDVAMKVLNHSVIVTGLTPGATYYFRAVSHGSLAISTQHSFTTLTPEQAKAKAAGLPIPQVTVLDTPGSTGYSDDGGSGTSETGYNSGSSVGADVEPVYSMDFQDDKEPVGLASVFPYIGKLLGSTLFWIILLIILIIILIWLISRWIKRKKDSELHS
jgi:hypothetical protein